MGYCSHCGDYCPVIKDPDKGYICCATCGKILDQEIYSNEPTFMKDGSGQSRLAGNILHSMEYGYSASHQRTLMKGKDEIRNIVNVLQMSGGESMIDKAHRFYQIAVDKNFTRGRRTSHVAAACLYIACRQSKKAYLLIDFSDYLQINVYVLGAVFLQLCKILLLAEHPIVQKLVDPSLFIHRFTERLLGRKNNAVSETALRIIASMKRDWMQTGRKPSGLCGAALYISALSHGLDYSKSEIVTVVHVCEATLTKRLIEFENTESGCLTIEEFLMRGDELDRESLSKQLPKPGEVLCKHKDSGAQHFAHGLCRKCHDKFIKISGGLDGGAEPPAFQCAEQQRLKAAKERAKVVESSHGAKSLSKDKDGVTSKEFSSDEAGNESQKQKLPQGDKIGSVSASHDSIDENGKEADEPESLSDLDDVEVDEYLLHNEEEKKYRKIIWEEMNREYLEEQAAKEAFANSGEDAEKPKKERKRKRSEDAKNSTPAQTPFEATCNMLKKKGFGPKINLGAVGGLYKTNDENGEKQKAEPDALDSYGNPDEAGDKDEIFDMGDAEAPEDGDIHEFNFNVDHENADDYEYLDDFGFE